jgi:hypothetical protein
MQVFTLIEFTVNLTEINNPALEEEVKRVKGEAMNHLRSTGWLNSHNVFSSSGPHILRSTLSRSLFN